MSCTYLALQATFTDSGHHLALAKTRPTRLAAASTVHVAQAVKIGRSRRQFISARSRVLPLRESLTAKGEGFDSESRQADKHRKRVLVDVQSNICPILDLDLSSSMWF